MLTRRRPSIVVVGSVGALGTLAVVTASHLDVAVLAAGIPLFCFFVISALLSSPTHRADSERRRCTVRAARRLTALLDDCSRASSLDAITTRIAAALVDLLDLHACWFEPGPSVVDLPELTADGDVTAQVQHRVDAGLVLPPVVALPVPGPNGPIGRFVLEADAGVGLSPERRLLAFAASRIVVLTTHRSDADSPAHRSTRTTGPA